MPVEARCHERFTRSTLNVRAVRNHQLLSCIEALEFSIPCCPQRRTLFPLALIPLALIPRRCFLSAATAAKILPHDAAI